nr:MmcQ/YjbR family DNA-binding protein [Phytoactinopolyspora endophytica]
MAASIDEFLEMIDRLPDVRRLASANYTTFKVHDKSFGFLWEATQTVGLKQPLAEQLALVAERPEVFEIQFTAGQFGWVVVHLDGIELDELAELVFEAWRLTAPEALVESHGERLPI